MLTWIFTHQWKQATRSAGWQQNLVMNIIMGIVMLFFALNLAVLGFFLDKMLEGIVPGQNAVLTFNKGIIYYLGLDLVLRFLFQNVPVLAVQPYLHLPVRRNKLLHLLQIKSLWSLANVLPLLLVGPFSVKAVFPAYGLLPVLAWSFGLLSLMLFNNFLNVYLKRQLALKPVIALLLIAGLIGLVAAEYYGVFKVSALTENVFATVLAQPVFGFLLPLLPAGMYLLNYRLLRHNMYISEPEAATAKVSNVHEFAFLKRFGAAGNLLALEMKLIWRNKRPRSLFLMSFMMIAYGGVLILSKDAREDSVPNSIMVIFAGILSTGACMIYYGQFLHSWDANYFDALMTRHINAYEYYRSKFLLFVGMCTLAMLLALFYAFIDWHFLPIFFALYLYNIGINAYLIFLIAIYGPKKIDLSKNSAFNWEGTGGSQFLMSFPLILGPALVYLPFYIFEQADFGLLALGGLGVMGLAFHKPILKKMAARLNARKYKLAAGFRAA